MSQQKILSNNPSTQRYVYSKLSYLFKEGDVSGVIIMVAFITLDGLYLILNELKDLLDKEVRITIITGFMNNFNNPKMFEFLSQFEGIELRVTNIASFHSKVYLFRHNDGRVSFILGSSNLTNSALRRNLEANIYQECENTSEIAKQVTNLYQEIYNNSVILTPELLERYRLNYLNSWQKRELNEKRISLLLPQPNSMQAKALKSLAKLRARGQNKALVISATGSGKTFLSAFDVKAFAAKRLLFVVHRETILNSAIESYRHIFPDTSFGKFTGEIKELQPSFIFASIQTLQKEEYLQLFKKDCFNYIIIDEVHRAGARGYQKILEYFTPRFLLGMTATPERSDGFDIYRLFDNNIAYEIRLNEALNEELVCPFHYFGISELMVNNVCLDDYSDFNRINYNDRVSYILHNLKLYGHGGNDKVRGLIFVSRIEEAAELSRLFNLAGYKSSYLSGADSDNDREHAIALLANTTTDKSGKSQEYLDYIFTVDIFNEGVDIPCVNQIVLLRPTQSAIIFIQQLGRGLRKSIDKNYCVVIDFIGNYKGNFLIATALSGNNSYDKEELRSFVSEANSLIPFNATVSFDRVTRERIYDSINNIQINRKFISQNYLELKRKLNRIPELIDFKTYNSIDPKIIFRYQGKSSRVLFNNYYELLRYHDDISEAFTENQLYYLDYITQELLFAARPDELYVLANLIAGTMDEIIIYQNLVKEYAVLYSEEKRVAIRKILSLETSAALQKKYKLSLIDSGSLLRLSDDFIQNLEDLVFKSMVVQTLALGLSYFTGYKKLEKNKDFILYRKYSRKELVRLLNVSLSMETSIYGYRIIAGSVPIFITYNKLSPNRINAKYENVFLNNQDLIWYSRPYGKVISSEVERIINYRQNNLSIMIFLKKSDNEGSDYYYLGNADIHSFSEEIREGKNIMKFTLRLMTGVSDTYFDYFTN